MTMFPKMWTLENINNTEIGKEVQNLKSKMNIYAKLHFQLVWKHGCIFCSRSHPRTSTNMTFCCFPVSPCLYNGLVVGIHKQEGKEGNVCMSHSKVGVIMWQGGIQQIGSRARKLQIIQNGELKKGFLFYGNEWDERKMLPENNALLRAIWKSWQFNHLFPLLSASRGLRI